MVVTRLRQSVFLFLALFDIALESVREILVTTSGVKIGIVTLLLLATFVRDLVIMANNEANIFVYLKMEKELG